jgi:hypothetical protein
MSVSIPWGTHIMDSKDNYLPLEHINAAIVEGVSLRYDRSDGIP